MGRRSRRSLLSSARSTSSCRAIERRQTSRRDRAENLLPPQQEQLGDPAGCLGTTFGIAMFDEFIKPGDQRRGKCHQTHSNPGKPQSIDEFSGNSGGPGEGRVRFEASRNGCKITLRGLRGPCRIAQKPLYQPQLMVLIRSRIESGPLGTRSFLLPERGCAINGAGLARAAQPDRP